MLFDFAHDDRQVRERLFDARCTAAATSVEALHHDRLADIGLGDDQRINVEVVVVLGVCDCRFKGLANGTGNTLAREFQVRESAVNLLATDESGDEVELLRADANGARNRLRFVVLEPARGFCLANRYFLFAFLSAP